MCSAPWGARSTTSTARAADTAYTMPMTASWGRRPGSARVRAKRAAPPTAKASAYQYALAFAVGGAALFALTRAEPGRLPHEAVIGIVYAVSAALAVLVVDRAPQGAEHIKQLL